MKMVVSYVRAVVIQNVVDDVKYLFHTYFNILKLMKLAGFPANFFMAGNVG